MKKERFDFKRCLYKKNSKMPGGNPFAFLQDPETTDKGS